jgi:ribosomal protein L11 methyltransferase
MMHQAIIEADASRAERIALALEQAAEPEAVAVGWFERSAGRFEVFAHYDEAPPREALLRLIAQAAGDGEIGLLDIKALPEADWVILSQGKRPPVRAGRFFVHGSHDRGRAPQHRFVVEIDAGQAFGTAHHASTQGCLLALDRLLKQSRPRLVLDIGTGTGVLAIAASHALKRSVLASDSDPLAVTTARANAGENCAGSQVKVLRAAGFAHSRLRRLKADLIFANLLDRTLRELAREFCRHTRNGGVAVLSGITSDQARGIEAVYRNHGFIPERRIVLDGWTTLMMRRRSAGKARKKQPAWKRD